MLSHFSTCACHVGCSRRARSRTRVFLEGSCSRHCCSMDNHHPTLRVAPEAHARGVKTCLVHREVEPPLIKPFKSICACQAASNQDPWPNATPYIGALVVQQGLGAKCLRTDACLCVSVFVLRPVVAFAAPPPRPTKAATPRRGQIGGAGGWDRTKGYPEQYSFPHTATCTRGRAFRPALFFRTRRDAVWLRVPLISTRASSSEMPNSAQHACGSVL